jgi:transposase
VLEPHVAEVVLAHPKRVRAIAEAKTNTDKVDARVLAELLAADYIPRVWIRDELPRMLRGLVARRRGLVKRHTQDQERDPRRAAPASLQGRPPVSDLRGRDGRAWLAEQELPIDERLPSTGACASWTSSAQSSTRSVACSPSRSSTTKLCGG